MLSCSTAAILSCPFLVVLRARSVEFSLQFIKRKIRSPRSNAFDALRSPDADGSVTAAQVALRPQARADFGEPAGASPVREASIIEFGSFPARTEFRLSNELFR
jgi:hypothetical protein